MRVRALCHEAEHSRSFPLQHFGGCVVQPANNEIMVHPNILFEIIRPRTSFEMVVAIKTYKKLNNSQYHLSGFLLCF